MLYKYVYPPVRKVLDERRDTIDQALSSTKKDRDEAQVMLTSAETQLRNVRLEAHHIISDAQNQGQTMLRDYEQRATQEYRELRHKKELELQKMEEEFFKKIEGHLATLVVNACEKVIRLDLTDDQRATIIRKRVQELENLKDL